jgi:hypothetical protein
MANENMAMSASGRAELRRRERPDVAGAAHTMKRVFVQMTKQVERQRTCKQ